MILFKVITCLLLLQAISAEHVHDVKDAPFVVSIHHTNKTQELLCTGVLLTNKVVLTAARCLVESTPDSLMIKYNTLDYQSASNQTKTVNSTKLHPDYNVTLDADNIYREHDVAVMILNSEVSEYNSSYIKLPEQDEASEVTNYTVYGYEFNLKEDPHKLKYYDNLWINSNNECNSVIRNVRKNAQVYPTQFCARHVDKNLYTKKGDSGAPFVRKNGDQYKLVGLASAVTTTVHDKQDRPIFTQVSLYSKWIKDQMNGSIRNATYGYLMMVVTIITIVKNFIL